MLVFSCVSTNSLSLVKGKTQLSEVQKLYSNKSQNQKLEFYKTYTNSNTNKVFNVYIGTENAVQNYTKTNTSQILNQSIRYLIFNSENIYVDTVQNPFNIQKNINKL